MYANGVHVEGKRYTVVSAGDHELHAKSGAAGVLVARTCLALVIAFYDAEQRAESCNATLLALTDYLRSCSYKRREDGRTARTTRGVTLVPPRPSVSTLVPWISWMCRTPPRLESELLQRAPSLSRARGRASACAAPLPEPAPFSRAHTVMMVVY